MAQEKLILVIGATGAQGIAVIDALLAASADGTPSPYKIRAFTRDPSGKRAQALTAKGVECVKGSVDDLASVAAAFKGVYGAWVNTDSGFAGESVEIYAGLTIYEVAKRTPTLRHYIWSNLAYSNKLVNYNPDYNNIIYNGKGRVGEFLQNQPSVVSETGFTWSMVSTGPYMEMLNLYFFGPLNRRADGTHVFGAPIEQGHIPMIALKDLGFWARYSFDHRQEVSGKDLAVASDLVSLEKIVESFRKVTGLRAEAVTLPIDAWFDLFDNADNPASSASKSISFRQYFSGWWRLYRDDVIANTKDMAWLRKVHPGTLTIEKWMKDNKYTGQFDAGTLKSIESGSRGWSLSADRTAHL